MERVGSSQGSAGSCGELQVGNRLCLHHDVMQHKPTYLYKVPQKLHYMVGLMLVQGIKTVSKYIRFVIIIIKEASQINKFLSTVGIRTYSNLIYFI